MKIRFFYSLHLCKVKMTTKITISSSQSKTLYIWKMSCYCDYFSCHSCYWQIFVQILWILNQMDLILLQRHLIPLPCAIRTSLTAKDINSTTRALSSSTVGTKSTAKVTCSIAKTCKITTSWWDIAFVLLASINSGRSMIMLAI